MIFILGAQDPEMREIESVLTTNGLSFVVAIADGLRVYPGNAYRASGVSQDVLFDQAVTVECSVNGVVPKLVIDHHRPGDPGFGIPPERYMEGSSLGQLLTLLEIKPTQEQRIVAAADHCLTAAYKGLCPGVHPAELTWWRAKTRAAFQSRPVRDIVMRIERAKQFLHKCRKEQDGPVLYFDDSELVPELSEAAAQLGIPVCSTVTDQGGRRKQVLMGANSEVVQEHMDMWTLEGREVYGDPQRGFAGGYLVA